MILKKINALPLLICILIFACNSPQRYMYSTPAANVCYFKEKNDSKLAAYYFEGGPGGNSNKPHLTNTGFDVQTGYAYSNNWAVTAAYWHRDETDSSYFNYEDDQNRSIVKYKRNLIELGLGRFSLNKGKKSTGNLFFGVGFGNYRLQDDGIDTSVLYSKIYKISFYKFYFQPSVNIVVAKYVHAAFGGRISFMQYGTSSTTYTNVEKSYWHFDRLDRAEAIFVEPNINLQLGLPEADWIRFEANLNFLLFDFGYPLAETLSKRKGGLSVGLAFSPSKAFKK